MSKDRKHSITSASKFIKRTRQALDGYVKEGIIPKYYKENPTEIYFLESDLIDFNDRPAVLSRNKRDKQLKKKYQNKGDQS